MCPDYPFTMTHYKQQEVFITATCLHLLRFYLMSPKLYASFYTTCAVSISNFPHVYFGNVTFTHWHFGKLAKINPGPSMALAKTFTIDHVRHQ